MQHSYSEKDFAYIDLTSISPSKPARHASKSIDYAKFRNDRVLSVQDRRNRQDATLVAASVKRSLFAIRRGQLVLRTLQLVGSGGLVACLILLENIPSVQSYIVRAPACVDVASSFYAICHLARSASHRTPSSSSAYHFFALIIDAGLIPFYVFTALLTHAELSLSSTDTARWTSSIVNGAATGTLIQATWFGALVVGGLHLVTLGISLYLCVMFRKVSKLPPDMNPFESHLTSRSSRSMRGAQGNAGETANGISRPISVLPRPMSFFGARQNHTAPLAATTSRTNLTVPNSPYTHYDAGSDDRQGRPPYLSNATRKITPRAETPPPLPDDDSHEHDFNHSHNNPNFTTNTSFNNENLTRPHLPSLLSSSSSIYTASLISQKSPVLPDLPFVRHSHAPSIPRKSSRRLRSDMLTADNWFVRSDDEEGEVGEGEEGREEGEAEGDRAGRDGGDGGDGGIGRFDFGLLASTQQAQKYAPISQDRLNRLEFDDDLASDLGMSPELGFSSHLSRGFGAGGGFGRRAQDENAGGNLGEGGTVRVRRTMAPRLPSFMQPLGMNPPTPRGSRLELRGGDGSGDGEGGIAEEGSDYLGAGAGAGGGAGASGGVLGEVAGNVGAAGMGSAGGARYHNHSDLAYTPRSKRHTYDIGANKPDWGFNANLPGSPNHNHNNHNSKPSRTNVGTRVISSTGVDIGDTRMEYLEDEDAAFEGVRKGLRGRNVSGMRMEEGGAGGY